MRHLINITEASDDAAEDDAITQLLKRFGSKPEKSSELGISVKTLIALAAKNYVVCDGKLSDINSVWSLTANGKNYLSGQPIVEESSFSNDGEHSPLTRKRKRVSDPSKEKWFKSLFSK